MWTQRHSCRMPSGQGKWRREASREEGPRQNGLATVVCFSLVHFRMHSRDLGFLRKVLNMFIIKSKSNFCQFLSFYQVFQPHLHSKQTGKQTPHLMASSHHDHCQWETRSWLGARSFQRVQSDPQYKLVITEHVRPDPSSGTCPVWLKLACWIRHCWGEKTHHGLRDFQKTFLSLKGN